MLRRCRQSGVVTRRPFRGGGPGTSLRMCVAPCGGCTVARGACFALPAVGCALPSLCAGPSWGPQRDRYPVASAQRCVCTYRSCVAVLRLQVSELCSSWSSVHGARGARGAHAIWSSWSSCSRRLCVAHRPAPALVEVRRAMSSLLFPCDCASALHSSHPCGVASAPAGFQPLSIALHGTFWSAGLFHSHGECSSSARLRRRRAPHCPSGG